MRLFIIFFLLLIVQISHCKGKLRVSDVSVLTILESANESFHDGNYENAQKYYQDALAKDASNPRTHFGLGCTYLMQSQYELAIEHLKRTVDLNPAMLEAYFALSSAFYAIHDEKNASIYFRKGLGLDMFIDISSFNKIEIK